MLKSVQQVTFAAVIMLAIPSAGQAQQTGAPPIDAEMAAIVPVIMAKVNGYGRVQINAQVTADAAIDLATLNSANDLGQRLADINAYVEAANDMIAILRAAPTLAAYQARGQGMSAARQTQALVLMDNSLNAAGASEIVRKMQSDRRYFQAWAGLLAMLRNQTDLWSTEDGDSLAISFKNADFEAAFWTRVDAILLAEKNTNRNAGNVGAATGGDN